MYVVIVGVKKYQTNGWSLVLISTLLHQQTVPYHYLTHTSLEAELTARELVLMITQQEQAWC